MEVAECLRVQGFLKNTFSLVGSIGVLSFQRSVLSSNYRDACGPLSLTTSFLPQLFSIWKIWRELSLLSDPQDTHSRGGDLKSVPTLRISSSKVEATPQRQASHLPTLYMCVRGTACFSCGPDRISNHPRAAPSFRKPPEPRFFHKRVYLAHPSFRNSTMESGLRRPEGCCCLKGREESTSSGLWGSRAAGSASSHSRPHRRCGQVRASGRERARGREPRGTAHRALPGHLRAHPGRALAFPQAQLPRAPCSRQRLERTHCGGPPRSSLTGWTPPETTLLWEDRPPGPRQLWGRGVWRGKSWSLQRPSCSRGSESLSSRPTPSAPPPPRSCAACSL